MQIKAIWTLDPFARNYELEFVSPFPELECYGCWCESKGDGVVPKAGAFC